MVKKITLSAEEKISAKLLLESTGLIELNNLLNFWYQDSYTRVCYYYSFIHFIKLRRKQLGLSYEDIALKMGIKTKEYISFEVKRRRIRVWFLQKLMDVLDIYPNEIFNREDKERELEAKVNKSLEENRRLHQEFNTFKEEYQMKSQENKELQKENISLKGTNKELIEEIDKLKSK